MNDQGTEQQSVEIKVVTQNEGVIHEGRARSVKLETQDGPIQILPGTQLPLTVRKEGKIVIEKEDGKEKVIFDMRVGIAEVIGGAVVILADTIRTETAQAVNRATYTETNHEEASPVA